MNYYNEIRNELINNEAYKKVKDYSKNKSDLMTYYNVGKLLVSAQGGESKIKNGNQIIKEYSEKLMNEVSKSYNERTLRRIRQFYITFKEWSTLSTNLTWSHYSELLILTNKNTINYYIEICKKQNLSVRELRTKIKNKEYERLDEETKNKLIINNENTNIKDFIKHLSLSKINTIMMKYQKKY